MGDLSGRPNLERSGLLSVDEAMARARAITSKPRLEVDEGNLPGTAEEVARILARQPRIFRRGGQPVALQIDADTGRPTIVALSADGVVLATHAACTPVGQRRGRDAPVTLSRRVGQLVLELGTELPLRPLAGLCAGPILRADGTVVAPAGYDEGAQLWSRGVPDLVVPHHPTQADAEEALRHLRELIAGYPLADAERVRNPADSTECVDPSTKPGDDETACLAALLTAICRPSLPLAPGIAVLAPSVSGSGAGKGTLARMLGLIANGEQPRALNGGGSVEELDKRVSAALLAAEPMLYLDNLNDVGVRSDVLASVLTEVEVAARLLGRSEVARLHTRTLVLLTGNGLRLSEDLVRRVLTIQLDSRTEHAESRRHRPGFLDDVMSRRTEILSQALTIWRWGRQQEAALPHGLPLASYETWARWVRDPLLALGCRDPVQRIRQSKNSDPRRQQLAEAFAVWHRRHGDRAVAVANLDRKVLEILDLRQRSRQAAVSELERLTGTRLAGYVLERHKSPARWSRATYRLRRTEDSTGA